MNRLQGLMIRWTFRAYSARQRKKIVRNLQDVLETCDIDQLQKPTYQFLQRHLLFHRSVDTLERFQIHYRDMRHLGYDLTGSGWLHKRRYPNLLVMARPEVVLIIYEDREYQEERYGRLPGTLPNVFYRYYASAAQILREMLTVTRLYKNRVVYHYEQQKACDLIKAESILSQYRFRLSSEQLYQPGIYIKDPPPKACTRWVASTSASSREAHCPIVPTW